MIVAFGKPVYFEKFEAANDVRSETLLWTGYSRVMETFGDCRGKKTSAGKRMSKLLSLFIFI
jgi:hypothetical protein